MVENVAPVKTANKKCITRLAAYGGILVIVAILPLVVHSAYMMHVFILTLIYIIASTSLRTITISGQLPLAHAAFMGIAGYTSAMLSKWVGVSPWICIILGSLMATIISIFIGYPFARLRTIYYTMVSLFFGTAILSVIFTLGKWTGSYSGMTGIQGLFPGTTSKIPYFYFILAITVVSLIALWRFENCRIGLCWKAIAQSYTVASSVGINEARYRVLSLAVGSFFVGVAGTMYTFYNMTLAYTSFNLTATLWLFMYVLIGGISSFPGPIVGATILIIIPELFRELKAYAPFISAAILLIVVFILPQGLAGIPALIRNLYLERKRGGTGKGKPITQVAR